MNASFEDMLPQNDIILVINCGSSTVKYKLLQIATNQILLKGVFEGIEQQQVKHCYEWLDDKKQLHKAQNALSNASYSTYFHVIAEIIKSIKCAVPTSVGHRVVHGGEKFIKPTLIDSTIIDEIEQLSVLAPLHNPINLQGIRLCIDLFPNVPHIAVFDTAFHQSMPEHAYRYPIAEYWYLDHDIRKYGFHGTSHQYVAQQAADYLQKPLAKLNLITLHLGNGDSVTAIKQGQCIDTSMGFTPLAGLMMGTRCGDIDPAIPLYMQKCTTMGREQIRNELNHKSGLLAVAGTQDMREILKRSDPESELAVNMYCYRIKKYLGSYLALLGPVDAIIFTAGVGENSAEIRSRCCQQLEHMGINIDASLNEHASDDISTISTHDSPIKLLVIKTNEERQIANEVSAFIKENLVLNEFTRFRSHTE